MCYCGCDYEEYPYGTNESCVCNKPKNTICPFSDKACEVFQSFFEGIGRQKEYINKAVLSTQHVQTFFKENA